MFPSRSAADDDTIVEMGSILMRPREGPARATGYRGTSLIRNSAPLRLCLGPPGRGENKVNVRPWMGALKGRIKLEGVSMYRLMHAQELIYIERVGRRTEPQNVNR